MMSKNTEILRLFKTMMRESQKFPSYNFREYALERIRHGFKSNKNLSDSVKIQNALRQARSNLDIIKRQALIGQMYLSNKLIIENTT